MRLTLAQVLGATSGRALNPGPDAVFDAYHTDSRGATSGLFFALRGAERDGHQFVADAVRNGATGVVVERGVEAPGVAVIEVADAWRALFDLAAYALDQVAPLVVGVTGSNGKTSTKEMTAAVLGTRHRVLKSEGNLNTETGVPLTILGLQPEHEVLVLEMGMQGAGEIARLAALARPRIGVVTNVGTVHLQFFESRRQLALAKAELVRELAPGGRAVLPAEDGYCSLLAAASSAPVTTFGLGAGDVRGEAYEPLAGGCRFLVEEVEVRLAMPGRHQARNALAALAVADAVGVPRAEAAAALAQVQLAQRLQERVAPAGYAILDDSYNASPESMLAAFDAVADMPRRGRLLAVLGEMRELGEAAQREHVRVGQRAAAVFDELVVVAAGLGAELARSAGAGTVPDQAAAAAWVRDHARSGDLVLVKASRGVHLEDVVKELMEA